MRVGWFYIVFRFCRHKWGAYGDFDREGQEGRRCSKCWLFKEGNDK